MWNWNALSQQAAQQNAAAAAPESAPVPQRLSRGPLIAGAAARSATNPRASATAPARARSASQQAQSHARRPQPPNRSVSTAATAAVGGGVNALTTNHHAPVDVEEFSRLRIAHRTIPATDVHTELSERKFIPLHKLDTVARETFTTETLDWVTIGVLTRKTLSKASATGGSFIVWSLSDLNATELGVFLFSDAYNTHWRETEGAIVAVLNATLLPASNAERQFAFKVAHANEIVKLGVAVDFGICKGTNSTDARCRLAVNTAKSQYCLHHITANFLKAGKGRQQLNSNVSGVGLRKQVLVTSSQHKNLSAGVYLSTASIAASAAAAAVGGWYVPASTKHNKRKRSSAATDAHTFHGGALRLDVSGAVTQTAPRPTKKPTATATAQQPIGTANNKSAELKSSARSQRIIASVLASSANGQPASNALQQHKMKKRVDMMQFMNANNKKTMR